jgi:hypothetical protein
METKQKIKQVSIEEIEKKACEIGKVNPLDSAYDQAQSNGRYLGFKIGAKWMQEQAKEMHKQEIVDAYRFGLSDEYVIGSENYYKETFGGKDEQ